MLHNFLKFNFCANRNYTSTFKIRSRLSEFFKHVHPDQLTQAPTKVKEQNLRSLTNFNSYIDSISQGKSIDAEKTNAKSKKFFSFSVELPQVTHKQADMSEDKAKKLIDNIVDVLNKKFMESKSIKVKNGKMKQDDHQKVQSIRFEDKQTQEDRFDRMSKTIKPFDRKSKLTDFQGEMLKSALNSKYMEAEKESLSTKLKKSISFADTGRNKPMMWSRIANQQSGIYKDFQSIMDQLIDPRLIYFNESLGITEIEDFKSRLLPGSLNRDSYKASKIITEVCAKMESFQPPICFYVSNKYSSTQIPGFLTIPYNFKAQQLGSYFEKQIDTVVEEQQKFQQFYQYERELANQLKKQNNFHLDEINFKNNEHIRSYVLMLKRLQKYRLEQETGVSAFDSQTFYIFKQNYQMEGKETVAYIKNKLVLAINFKDSEMQQVISMINRKAKSEDLQ